jgi:hypothetical protein
LMRFADPATFRSRPYPSLTRSGICHATPSSPTASQVEAGSLLLTRILDLVLEIGEHLLQQSSDVLKIGWGVSGVLGKNRIP